MYLPNKEPTAFELPACRQAGEPNELPTAPPRNMSLYKNVIYKACKDKVFFSLRQTEGTFFV
jgi:hypothetical protein